MNEAGETAQGAGPRLKLVAGSITVDTTALRLFVDGAPARIAAKSVQVLMALMQSPQRLVTKEELLERVWEGMAVSESVLTTAIKEARAAIGDDARQPSYIETLHRRGYQFMRPVETRTADEVHPAAAPRSSAFRIGHRWAQLAAALAAVATVVAGLIIWDGRLEQAGPHPKSVAVLPFRDISPAPAQQWFADGLTVEIINGLSKAPDIRVSDVMANVGVIEGEIRLDESWSNAAQIVKGSVRRADGMVRVSVQLLRAADGTVLWSENYDRGETDLIAIQEDVAFDIAQALKTVADPTELRAMLSVGTRSVAAYEAYLRGLSEDQASLDDGNADHARSASAAYEEARAIDPGFAAAHWAAAQKWFGNSTRVNTNAVGADLSDKERIARYVERVDAAISATKDSIERLRYRYAKAVIGFEFEAARDYLADYLKERPRDMDAWEDFALVSGYLRDRRGMRRAARRLHDLSMEAQAPRSRAITIAVMSGDFAGGAAIAREQLKATPDAAMTNYQAHRALLWSGAIGEARQRLDALAATALPADSIKLALLRQACAEGRETEAHRIRSEIDLTGNRISRWQAAQLFADDRAAHALLSPLDTPDGHPTLLQYLFIQTFDASRYPGLLARLPESVADTPALKTPYQCRQIRSGAPA